MNFMITINNGFEICPCARANRNHIKMYDEKY